jgi:branched-chain amino acid transport system permease protein
MDVSLLLQTIANFLVLSSMYVLVGLGFAFLFNMLGILNLAHGAIYMVSGYLGYVLITEAGINQWIAVLITILIVSAFGIFLQEFCFRPFIGNFNRLVMVCVAISVILSTTVNLIAGTKSIAIPSFAEGVLNIGSISISYEKIVACAIGIILLLIIVWFVNRTKLGKQMQAIAQNREGAALQGISIRRISIFSCALGCAFAAIAGCLMGSYLSLAPFMGDNMLNKTLMLVMLAGAGSTGGIFITGLIIGCLDTVLPIFVSGNAGSAIVVALLIILLLFRPQGFFGHEA